MSDTTTSFSHKRRRTNLVCVCVCVRLPPVDNVFDVRLLKNTSGLGFSFSREENVPDEPLGTSMVRVKKLFPGQPAAESGLIRVGDVILRVNQTPLKGLTQHVCYAVFKASFFSPFHWFK